MSGTAATTQSIKTPIGQYADPHTRGGNMLMIISFRFNHEDELTAETGVEGDVTDILLPAVGDVVDHRDINDVPVRARSQKDDSFTTLTGVSP